MLKRTRAPMRAPANAVACMDCAYVCPDFGDYARLPRRSLRNVVRNGCDSKTKGGIISHRPAGGAHAGISAVGGGTRCTNRRR
jgi:hypothetical protein